MSLRKSSQMRSLVSCGGQVAFVQAEKKRTFQKKHREVKEPHMFGIAAAKTAVEVGAWDREGQAHSDRE